MREADCGRCLSQFLSAIRVTVNETDCIGWVRTQFLQKNRRVNCFCIRKFDVVLVQADTDSASEVRDNVGHCSWVQREISALRPERFLPVVGQHLVEFVQECRFPRSVRFDSDGHDETTAICRVEGDRS